MKYLIPVFLIVFLVMPTITYGQDELDEQIEKLLDDIGYYLLLIAGGLAVIVFIISGIMYLTSSGDEIKITKAKKILLYGIIGTAIAGASGWILRIIEDILAAAGVM